MALRINLKPNEKIIIGKTLIRNNEHKSSFVIEGNDVPILRERYILSESDINTPVQYLYYLIQLMYVSETAEDFVKAYFEQLNEITKAAPSMTGMLINITELVSDGKYYKAMQSMLDVLEYEKKLLEFDF